MLSLASSVSYPLVLAWLSWNIGGSVHFFFLPLDLGSGADSPPTLEVSGAIWTGGMALSVDAPQEEVAELMLSRGVTEDGLKVPKSEAFVSGSGLRYGFAVYAAAAGTGGSGYKSFWSAGLCNSTCVLELTFSRMSTLGSSDGVAVSDVLRELVGCSAPLIVTSSSETWLFGALSALWFGGVGVSDREALKGTNA